MADKKALIKVTPENVNIVKAMLFLSCCYIFLLLTLTQSKIRRVTFDIPGLAEGVSVFVQVMLFLALGAFAWGVVSWLSNRSIQTKT